MVASTNIDGSNPGPNIGTVPDTVQSPTANIWKLGSFTLSLTPASVTGKTVAEQTFTMTGLLTTDFVYVNKPTAQANLGIAGSRVSAAGVLAISYCNVGQTTITPTSETYTILVARVQPNWSAPTSGALLDW